jgi:2-enoate reductase
MKEYESLFKSIKIGNVEIKNRFSMAPMGPFGLADKEGAFNQKGVDYYVERAKGGTGLIITGICSVINEIEGLETPSIPCPTLNPGAFMVTAKEMTERVHAYGSKIFLQLTAGFGRAALPHLVKRHVAPSGITNRWDPKIEHNEITVEEIQTFVKKFAEASAIAKMAGFDGVEIHAVHEGYLLDQFAISLYNKRTDEYGGDLNGRLKFTTDIVKAIKVACGNNFPVSLRYSVKSFVKGIRQGALPGEEFVEKGKDLEEGIEGAKILEAAGYDALNVDAGTYDSWYWNHPPMYFGEGGMYMPFGKAVKEAVNVPVILAGRMEDPKLATKALEEGCCDIIGLGRPLLADPYVPNKIKKGEYSKVRTCISCHEGCMGRIASGATISCAVNPNCGRERIYDITPADKKKNVVVVGGGLAGMEASRVSALRGHEVHLYEKSDKLGGNVIPGGMPSFKKDDHVLIKWYEGELKDLNIDINFNTEVNEEMLKEANADVIIVATGSTPIFLNLKGYEKNNVMTADNVLLDSSKAGNKVAVIGGGLVGCETALWLRQMGKDVTVVEALPDILGGPHGGIPFMNYDMLKDLVKYNEIKVITASHAKEVTESGLLVEHDGTETLVDADTIIFSVGYRSNNSLYSKVENLADEVYLLGDAKNVRNIMFAIWDAYEIARQI